MSLEISPEPPPEEREALELMIERLRAGEKEDSRPAWWRAGLPDADEGDDEAL